jgi:hypothetical protein
VSEVKDWFTGSCSLHDGDTANPATDEGMSVGMAKRRNESLTRRNKSPSGQGGCQGKDPPGTIKRRYKRPCEGPCPSERVEVQWKKRTACQVSSVACPEK